MTGKKLADFDWWIVLAPTLRDAMKCSTDCDWGPAQNAECSVYLSTFVEIGKTWNNIPTYNSAILENRNNKDDELLAV